MPGQGRRVWQFSQFRFRIVYSIPQINLPSHLWSSISERPSFDAKSSLTLPELSSPIAGHKNRFYQLTAGHYDISKQELYRNNCGEASWVSFSRVIQHSSGKSLHYEMIEGDTDRCPTDLPVVSMQLSMRDVITVAIMAGMECTDVSFQNQSLSMQGSAGTIISSRHPILGALIHFAPRQSHEKHGLRINNGTINPCWMARMWDVTTVAGFQYNRRARRHFEEDEGPWARLSGDRRIVKHQKKHARQKLRSVTEVMKHVSHRNGKN